MLVGVKVGVDVKVAVTAGVLVTPTPVGGAPDGVASIFTLRSIVLRVDAEMGLLVKPGIKGIGTIGLY